MPKWVPELHSPKWLHRAYKIQTVRQIAAELGCSPAAVGYALKRHGIKARLPGRERAAHELKDREWLLTQYPALTTWEIAARLGCAQVTVWKAMRSLGIPMGNERRRRRKYPYKQLTDPRTGKPVLEHRYLMELHLDRKLESGEHVHHIDGDKSNNDLANLVILTHHDHAKLHNTSETIKERMKHVDRLGYTHCCQACKCTFKGGNRALRCPGCRASNKH